MSSFYKNGKLLSGVIYLHRITNICMDSSPIKYVKMFKRLCGPDAPKNVLLTTAQWSSINPAQGESRERELRDGGFWGGLIAEGASVARFMGTRESGLELIDRCMRNKPMAQTNLEKSINEEFISLQQKYQEEAGHLETEIHKAIGEGDYVLMNILLQEQRKAQERLIKAAPPRMAFLALSVIASGQSGEVQGDRPGLFSGVAGQDRGSQSNLKGLSNRTRPDRGHPHSFEW